MEENNIVSDFTQGKLKKTDRNKQWRDAGAFLCILLGSLIVAVNMNTFVEQGKLVPGGFSGLAKLIQRVGLTFYDVKISFTVLNVLFNAIPAVFAYRLVGRKFTILSCISLLTVSVLVDELPVIPITGDILLISVFGGILNGLGMSLILNHNASGGGTDFIAMSLSVKYKVSTFNYMLLFSAVIILVSGAIFGMDKALYSIIFQIPDLLPLLSVKYVSLCHVRVSRFLQDLLHTVLDILHRDPAVLHLSLEIGGHPNGQQFNDIIRI